MLRRRDHVIAISEDFVQILQRQQVNPARVSVVENWAPLEEMSNPPRGSAPELASRNPERPRLIYSGTLGYKHNPDLLLRIAEELSEVLVLLKGAAKE